MAHMGFQKLQGLSLNGLNAGPPKIMFQIVLRAP